MTRPFRGNWRRYDVGNGDPRECIGGTGQRRQRFCRDGERVRHGCLGPRRAGNRSGASEVGLDAHGRHPCQSSRLPDGPKRKRDGPGSRAVAARLWLRPMADDVGDGFRGIECRSSRRGGGRPRQRMERRPDLRPDNRCPGERRDACGLRLRSARTREGLGRNRRSECFRPDGRGLGLRELHLSRSVRRSGEAGAWRGWPPSRPAATGRRLAPPQDV